MINLFIGIDGGKEIPDSEIKLMDKLRKKYWICSVYKDVYSNKPTHYCI